MKFSYRLYPSLAALHALAQSFDRDETHQFKLEARSKSGVAEDLAYVKFFDILVRFPNCDEAAIRKALAEEAETILGRFTDSRSYLYHRLLNALRKVHGNLTTDVADIAAQIQVLIHKGLYQHIDELYQKGLEFATATEDFSGLLGLMELWKAALIHNLGKDGPSEELQQLYLEELRIREKETNLHDWQRLLDLRAIAVRCPSEKRSELLSQIHQHPLYLNDGPCLSVKAEIRRLSLKEKLLGLDRLDHEGRLSILMEIADLIEKHPSLLENVLVVERYLYSMYNYGILGIVLRIPEAIDQSIQRLTLFAKGRREMEALVFERVAKLHLARDLEEGDIDAASVSASKALSGIKKFGMRLSPKHHIELVLHVALHFFHVGNWSELVRLLSKHLNEVPTFYDKKAVALLWIFYIIAQHEQENLDTMRSYTEYAQKYLKKHGLDSEVATTILTGLRRISTKNDPSKIRSEFLRFQREVLPILAQGPNIYYLQRLPFGTWLEYRLAGKRLSAQTFRKAAD